MTLKDIAKASGFSVSTVSTILSGKAETFGIKPETVDIVKRTAGELGYCRNDLAARVKSGKSNVLSLILPAEVGSHLYKAFLEAADIGINNGYYIHPVVFRRQDNFKVLIENVVSQRPAAFFAVNDLKDNFETLLEYSKKYKIPVAEIGDTSTKVDFCVISNEKKGIEEAVSWIRDNGHKMIGYVSEDLECKYAKRRYKYYQNLCAKYHISITPENCFHDNTDLSIDRLQNFVKSFRSASEMPSVIACSSDYLAMKLMMILLEAGYSIPYEISIIGFDGLEVTAYTVPKLATIEQQWGELAKYSITTMINLLNGEKVKFKHEIATIFKSNESVIPFS